MQRNGVIVLVSVALLSVAGIVATYLFTHKPEPEGPSAYDQSTERLHEEKVACLEGGGSWDPYVAPGAPNCQHSSVESAAPPVEGGGSGGSGGKTIQEVAYGTPEQAVNRMFTPAEQAQFCSLAIQAGFDAALRAWMSTWDTPGTTRSYAKEVFMEASSRCV